MAISQSEQSESIPLLSGKPPKKPYYRARPLWLVPFAILASLVRAMTLAPRLEVYTQLACNNLYGRHGGWNHTQDTISNFSSDTANIPLYASIDPLGPHLDPYSLFPEPGTAFIPNPKVNDDTDDTEDPLRIPSQRCVSDPEVQASAARLQTVMMTTMGLLSAFTTGWWGHFSERHGRTRLLAIATLGLLFTDVMFILVSTPSSPLSRHGYQLILLSSVIEGLLGGYSTLQSGTSSYLSDCTSSGSRAYIFSRFAGVVYLGFSIGPVIGGWLISHPIAWIGGSPIPGMQSVTSVFWVAIFFSFINFLLIAFVFPESLDKEKMERAMIAYKKSRVLGGGKGKARERALTFSSGDPGSSSADEEDNIEEVNRSRQEERESGVRSWGSGIISHFLSPLAIFLPVMVLDPSGLGKRRDWSLTLLAGGLFGYMLSTGIYQMKYLYARSTYQWGAEKLSYYISMLGGIRAIYLLFLLPTLISFIKPKPLPPNDQKGKGKLLPVLNGSSENGSRMVQQEPQPEQQQQQLLQKVKKPKPTRAQLGQEIGFDLLLTRFSLMIDIISQTLVLLFPAPAFTNDRISLLQTEQGRKMDFTKSQALFVVATSLTSFGSGAVPAIHSLGLCMLQVRKLDTAAALEGEDANFVVDSHKEEGTGPLFGAFAVLQTVGQMILGPMIFGLAYSETVGKFPKAVFAVAGALLVFALTVVLCVKNPVRPVYYQSTGKKKNNRRQGRDIERGRSRVSKDLRGGAIGINYGSVNEESGSSS